MLTSRRTLLLVAAATPVALVALRFDDALRAAGGVLRPRPAGTSATRCASCGASDHTMLDARCPAAPRVGAGRVGEAGPTAALPPG